IFAMRTAAAFLLLLVASACARESPAPPRHVLEPGSPEPVADIRLISPLPDGEWHLPAGDYANTRFSPLDAINTTNVAGLKVMATLSTGIPRGHEGQPLVVGGTMYVVTPFPN